MLEFFARREKLEVSVYVSMIERKRDVVVEGNERMRERERRRKRERERERERERARERERM